MRFKTALTIAAFCCAAPLFAQGNAAPAKPAAPSAAPTRAAAAPSPSAAIDPAKQAAIKHLLELTEISKMGDSFSTAISTQVRSVVGGSMAQDRLEKFMTSFDQRFRARATRESIEELIVPIYAQHFSTEEIQELIRFYESPLGQRVVKTLPEVAEQSQNAGIEFERDAALRTLHDMSDDYPELKSLLPAQAAPAQPSPGGKPAPATPAEPSIPGTPHR